MTTQIDTDTPPARTSPERRESAKYHDPNALDLETNVRDRVEDLNKDFISSLREHGVIVPITAMRGKDGRTVVRDGQCRTLGAREVGLAQVPVFVLTPAVERIVHQIVANDHRSALSDAQRARAVQTMPDTELSATKIAKRLTAGRDAVKAAGVAASSTDAMDALEHGQMNFEEAAARME